MRHVACQKTWSRSLDSTFPAALNCDFIQCLGMPKASTLSKPPKKSAAVIDHSCVHAHSPNMNDKLEKVPPANEIIKAKLSQERSASLKASGSLPDS